MPLRDSFSNVSLSMALYSTLSILGGHGAFTLRALITKIFTPIMGAAYYLRAAQHHELSAFENNKQTSNTLF